MFIRLAIIVLAVVSPIRFDGSLEQEIIVAAKTIDFTALSVQSSPSAADLGLDDLGDGDGIGGGGAITSGGYIEADPDGVNCLTFHGDETVDASLLLVANNEFKDFVDTADGYWTRCWFEISVTPTSTDGTGPQVAEVIGGSSNPHFQMVYGEPGATGDSGEDYSNDGKHLQINPYHVGGTGGYELAGENSAADADFPEDKRVRIPFGKRFRMEMQIARVSSSSYTVVMLIDGKPVRVRTGVPDSGGGSAANVGNRMNALKWEDIGDGSTTEIYKLRCYRAGYESATSGGFTGNYTGTADTTLTRSSDAGGNARVFSTPMGDADYSSCWDLSNLTNVASADYYQRHDAWLATRGYNAYPIRYNFDQAATNGSIRTREDNLAYPIMEGRAGNLWVLQPSDLATDSVGAKLVCRASGGSANEDIEFRVGFASTDDGESELVIEYGTSGGAINTQSTGITILTDKPWAFAISVDASGALGVQAQRLDLSNSETQQVFSATATGITGIPEDGFQFWVEFESANCSGNPGTFTMLDLLMLPRIPKAAESSVLASDPIAGSGDDNSTYIRAANLSQAGGELMGAGAIISEVESLGLFPRPYRAPGLQDARSGMNATEWADNLIGGDLDAYFAAGKAICPLPLDFRTNGLVQTGVPATDAADNLAAITAYFAAAKRYGVVGVFPIYTIPPAEYGSITAAVRTAWIAHDVAVAALEAQGAMEGWKVADMRTDYADIDAASVALFPTTDGTVENGTNFHTHKDFQALDDIYDNLRDATPKKAGSRPNRNMKRRMMLP